METQEVPDEKKPRGRPSKDLTAFGEWLRANEAWDKARIAESLGVSVSYVTGLCNGHKIPTKILALAVEHITNSEFKVERWENLSDSE